MAIKKKIQKRGLGRGLDALLGTKPKDVMNKDNQSNLTHLDVDLIKPGKFQPRTKMDMMKLRELADSIKAQGMVQPVIVREISKNNYEIIAGERRWRGTGPAP